MTKHAPATIGNDMPIADRKLSSKEAHDLGVLIRDRARVLKAHAEEQAAACRADFEKKISAIFEWDSDQTWKEITEDANDVIKKANEQIAKQALKKYGVPAEFAPFLALQWSARGQNRSRGRRDELRRLAEAEITAMNKAAVTKIERQSLDLRTQIISMGVMSENAKIFLESLAPVEESMGSIDFAQLEAKLRKQQEQKRLAGPGSYGCL